MESGRYMRPAPGRPVVSCPCQSSGNPGMNVPCSNGFPDNPAEFPIGMSYVPWQVFRNLYSPEKGLCEGTIFADLNQIFCGKRGSCA